MTYQYPTSISDAAAILDKAIPSWEKKINLNILDMCIYNLCILGQIYGNYRVGMEVLFGGHKESWTNDEILGKNTPYEKWIKEIQARSANADEVRDFAWALRQLYEGKKVSHPARGEKFFEKSPIGYLSNDARHHLGVPCLNQLITLNDGWNIYEPEIMLSAGVRVKNNKNNCEYICAEVATLTYALVNLKSGGLWSEGIKACGENYPFPISKLVKKEYIKDFTLENKYAF
jgi:hypothetical protein